MRKKFILFLTLIFLIVSLQTVYSEYNVEDNNEEIIVPADIKYSGYEKEFSVFVPLGIISIEDGNFIPDSPITRAEYAEMIFKTLGKDIAKVTNERFFIDVPDGSKGSDAINALAKMGYMIGTGEYIFEPEQAITLEHALKPLIIITGRQHLAELNGGFPLGYYIIAKQENLLKNINLKAGDVLTKGIAARLILRALCMDLYKEVGYTDKDNIKFALQKGVTLLGERFNIFMATGIVNAIGNSSLKEEVVLRENEIMIEEEKYLLKQKISDLFLGLRVEYYYKKSLEDNVGEIIYVQILENENEIIQVKAKEIYKNGVNREVFSFYQSGGGNEVLRQVPLSNIAKLVYNGRLYAYSANELPKLLTPSVGHVVLIDSDRNGVYDIIKVTSYETAVINYIDTDKGHIYCMYQQSYQDLNIHSSGMVLTVTLNGLEAELSSLRQWDVVEIAKSMDGKRITVVATRAVVTGKVVELDAERVTIDGETYSISDFYLKNCKEAGGNIENIRLNTEGIFIKNSTNEIIALKAAIASDLLYGFLLDATVKKGIDGSVLLKIFNEANIVEEVSCAEKITFNQEKNIDIRNYFINSVENELFSNGELKVQLVRYRKNSKNEIIELSTAEDISVSDVADLEEKINSGVFGRYVKKGRRMYRRVSSGLNAELYFNSYTKFLSVPDPDNITDREILTNPNYYNAFSTAPFSNGRSYTVEGYDIDIYGNARVIVHYHTNDIEDADPMYVFSKIVHVLDSDGAIRRKVYCLGELGETALILDDKVDVSGLNVGDVFQARFSPNGRVIAVREIMKISNVKSGIFRNYNTGGESSRMRLYCGKVYSVDYSSAMIRLIVNMDDILKNPSTPRTVRSVKALTPKVIIYDSEKKEISMGKFEDLIDGDIIFMRANYGDVKHILIIR